MTEAKEAIEIAQDGLKTASDVLTIYDKVLDRIIPWKELNNTLVELDKFRKDYSAESGALIGEIKTLMMNGIDRYYMASQMVYEWCSLVTPLVTSYILLFNSKSEKSAAGQKDILLKVFDDGILKLSESQSNLHASSISFNDASGKLIALQARFNSEFQAKSEFVETKVNQIKIGAYVGGALFGIPGVLIAHYLIVGDIVPKLLEKLKEIEKFYEKLREKVDQAGKDIEKTKDILMDEIEHIGEIKVKTQTAKTFVGLDDEEYLYDTVIQSAHELIAKCNEYRERHIKREFV